LRGGYFPVVLMSLNLDSKTSVEGERENRDRDRARWILVMGHYPMTSSSLHSLPPSPTLSYPTM